MQTILWDLISKEELEKLGLTKEELKTSNWNAELKAKLTKVLAKPAELLAKGEVVAFPTETVYGLGADGLNPEACHKIYAAKGRPADNPLILHISEKEEILALTSGLSSNAKRLIEAFWPGPMTLIVPKSSIIPEVVTAGLDTVAVRMPSNPIARTLIGLAHTPIAAPSANKSGRPSPTRADDVLADMEGIIAGVVDGGSCDIGVESTIIDTTVPVATILRPGGITLEMIERELGAVEIDPGLIRPDQVPKAPGMKYKHYAPKAEMYLVEGKNPGETVVEAARVALASGKRIGVIAQGSTIDKLKAALDQGTEQNLVTHSWGESQAEMAEHLFTDLRRFDEEKVDYIIGEGTGEENLGLAIMNRMRKSAAHNILEGRNGKVHVLSGKTPQFLPENMIE